MKNTSHNVILGIWDGHDAGAALVAGEEVLVAVNEERLSRRKLEVGMPLLSIACCLKETGLSPQQVAAVAVSTTDPAKTLTRLFPSLKEEYYRIRRRKKDPGPLDPFKKRFKYRFTELAPNALSALLSRVSLRSGLSRAGLSGRPLLFYDHHECHAQAAARCSGFDRALVVTIDGVGDGLSASVWRFSDGGLFPVHRQSSKASFGIFFEHVTNLMNMRELEDEGKVMALAEYAYPVKDEENPLMDLLRVEELALISPYSSTGLFRALKKILWRYPSEQFAYMAQRVLEKRVLEMVQNALSRTGLSAVCLSGGVFSNVKLNMKIADLEAVERIYVFPHMGDGGLALGAAVAHNAAAFGVSGCRLADLYRGPSVGEEAVKDILAASGLPFRRLTDAPAVAAEKTLAGEIILWFSGRMELGPRALGNRSILARPDDTAVRDRLNLALKKRVWYQPFCPSILAEDADALLEIEKGTDKDNPFMTLAFRTRPEHRAKMAGVINIDGTCRPQFVGGENPAYRRLLEKIKEALGHGVVLNTSFNIHGDPMVCTPEDAIETFRRTGVKYLFMENYLVERD
ncbi:MAG: carbamoyltransferase C-terminal domain-containing protein [Desulfobacterales bacterium]|jgi:carbamoyltransferase